MIAIIQYNAGNISSVQNALGRLGVEGILTNDPEVIQSADKVIFPGVGEASSAMNYLKAHRLDKVIPSLRQPVLGICLGQQLLCSHSEENDTTCMGVFDVLVKKFPPADLVPHMGWNSLSQCRGQLFSGWEQAVDAYFVHSYYAELCPDTAAVCDYILPFSAALQKDNFYGTQFHPEKSAAAGSLILQNFLSL